MSRVKSVTAYKMAKRICDREDNVYGEKIVKGILDMYMDECRKALLSGEKVQISKVCTIKPEVRTHLSYNLPACNKDGGNPPYTKLAISRTNLMHDAMNRLLIKNIENGIYGLENLPFDEQQINILKKSGYIPKE